MSYIGNAPISAAFLVDTFSGNGSTVAFTMTVAPANTSSIIVAITGVLQDPSTYSVSGTTLTFSAAPPSGTSNISVRYLGIPASGVTTTAYRTVTDFTATAGQTSFSVPSYTVGYIDVYRNGVRLVSTDYTATTGTTVVLNNACTVGDSVVTKSFYVSSVLNAIPNSPASVGSSNIVSGVTLTSPTLVTPALGTPASGVMTNVTAIPAAQITGAQAIPKSTLPTGSVLQVVEGVTSSETFTTSTSYVTTNLTATITPTSATSKVLITVSSTIYASNTSAAMHGILYRNGSEIGSGPYVLFFGEGCVGWCKSASTYLDSPASTSALTYTLYIKTSNGSYSAGANRNSTRNSIVLQEIAA